MAGEAPRRASILEVARTVMAAFFGVRRRAAHEQDTRHVSPVQIIVVALVLAALFIFTLVAIVHFVTSR
jgi:hypothetical protein